MKHLIVGILIVIVGICQLNAQSKFELGVTSGPEWNFPISKNEQVAYDYKPHVGFVTAVRLRHNFSTMFSLVGGFEYARVYFNEQIHNADYWNESGYMGNQVRIPILFQMNFGKRKSQFFFNTGPTFLYSFADLGKQTFWVTGIDSYGYIETFPKRLYQDANIGWMLGAGYSYSPLNYLRLFTEMRLCSSFFSTYSGIKNEGISMMSLTWSFGFSFKMKPPKKQF